MNNSTLAAGSLGIGVVAHHHDVRPARQSSFFDLQTSIDLTVYPSEACNQHRDYHHLAKWWQRAEPAPRAFSDQQPEVDDHPDRAHLTGREHRQVTTAP